MSSEARSAPVSATGLEARDSTDGVAGALYPFLMGADWTALDGSVQRFHGAVCDRGASGQFQIRRGRGRAARLLAFLLGLPVEGRDVATQLAVEYRPPSSSQSPGTETWRRNFAGQILSSTQYARGEKILAERFRTVELAFRLSADNGALLFESLGTAFAIGRLRLGLPSFLCARVHGRVTSVEGSSHRLHVSVEFELPLVGPVLSYEGYLDPSEDGS
jgi:hypothetical protein